MRKASFFILVSLLLLVSSCGTYKRLGYLQDMEQDITYSMPLQPDAIIAKGDKLSIQVVCGTPELAQPFNILNGTSVSSAIIEDKSADAKNAPESANEGYEVDKNGDILFPVLGRMHIEGLTIKQVKEKIESQIISRRYIKDPVAVIRFTNFSFTIIGEGGTGVYQVPDGRVNIFEALAMSGDLTMDAVRDDIWVVRTVDGKRRLHTINLKTKDCYYSPAFFIQQNDMIYIKPKNNKFDNTVSNRMSVLTMIISAVSATVNALIWTTYLSK